MRTKDFDEQDIIKKAAAIFWRKGYNATSMQDLIEGLGIGRSSIYHAFGDKHNLYLKALEQYQEEGTARFVSILNASPSIKDAVRNLFGMVTADPKDCGRPQGCFKVNSGVEVALDDADTLKILKADDVIIENALYTAIKAAQEKGNLSSSKDPRALARFICNTLTGMRVFARTNNDPDFFDDIISTALSVLD